MNLLQCNLCPNQCLVDRSKARGRCNVKGPLIRVGRASLHQWEEPCISGKNGSGTIFFSGCNLGCIYCQNKELSQKQSGVDITEKQLADIMISLQQKGAHNINLVTPTHYSIQIVDAVKLARKSGLNLPIVYNTSGYETVDAIDLLGDTVSVFLTDFKYADNNLGYQYSNVADYFEVAKKALFKMVQRVGKPVFDEQGMLISGVIVRHLVLPGHVDNSKKVLSYVYQEYGDDVILSIMNQYTPITQTPYSNLNRKVKMHEYDAVVDFAIELGVTNAFIQDDGTQEDSFIPKFDGEGVLNFDTDINRKG